MKNARIKPAALQIENHIFLQQPELVQFAQDQGIVVVAYSPLGSPAYGNYVATLGITYANLSLKTPGRSWEGKFFSAKPTPSILNHPTVNEIAKKHGKTAAHVALRFQIQRKIVVIPKSVTANRVKANINLFGFTLDEQDMTALRELDVGEACRVCDFKFVKV